MTVRYGVVGTGWISQIAFLPGTAQTGNSETTALVTGNAKGAGKLAEFYGIEHVVAYGDFDALLAGDIVDAVYIALPNSMHADFAIRAAKAGKHVLVEKPLAVSVAECEAMIAAAEAAGVFLMTAYRLHCEPGNLHAFDLIRTGAIGDPRLFVSPFSFNAGPDNHRLQAAHWGGPLQDIGIYCLNAARHVFEDEPIAVSAMRNAVNDTRFAEVEETVAATLLFPNGRIAQFCASFGADHLDMYRVAGTEGEIAVENAYDFQSPTTVRLTRGREVIKHSFPQIDQFAGQTAYFSDCILTATRPEPNGEEGLADVKILLALEEAAKTGITHNLLLAPRHNHPTVDMARHFEPTPNRIML